MSFLNGTDPGLRQIRAATTDNFAAGVDFTAGSSTSVTLTNDPGSEDNLIVTFDGITQHRNTYSVSGTVVTFDAAIGSGVSNVEATYTTTIPAASPADNSVTLAKLSDGTQGGLIYYAASGAPTELAAGTSGQYLQTQGAGANPQWASVTASGWAFVQKQTASASVTIDFTGLSSGYDYQITCNQVDNAADGYPYIQFGTGATPTWETSAVYYTQGIYAESTTITGSRTATNSSSPLIAHNMGGATAGEYWSGVIDILDPGNSSTETTGRFFLEYENTTNSYSMRIGVINRQATEAHTGIRIGTTGTNFTTGDFFLFRRANA